ncbi:MAG: PAS domain-containing protein [Bdellovibrio sp.]|nr:PAS domain-containing protein [Bdellovibrio sp.]
MYKPSPVNSPIEFGLNELFFSTTSPKGIIRSGNDVFIKISQYSKDELIGTPHNIIRHPDMPKLVFKVLWDTIKAGKPIAAYVKNMAKDGRYYWVLACVFPIKNGYLSIRLKPTSAIFPLMDSVYKAVQTVEQAAGIEAALGKLMEILGSKNFDSYESFMTTALIEELKSRDAISQNIKHSHQAQQFNFDLQSSAIKLCKTIEQIQRTCKILGSHYISLFCKIDSFLALGCTLEQKSSFIIDLAQEISMLSLNASIESSHTGSLGATLSMVAGELRLRSDEAKKGVKSVNEMAKMMVDEIKRIAFKIASSRLQVEMIDCFVSELLNKAMQQQIKDGDLAEIQENCTMLLRTLLTTSRESVAALRGFVARLAQLDIHLEKLESVVMALEVVRKTGIIESARIGNKGKNFIGLFEQMVDPVSSAKRELNEFREAMFEVKESIREADSADIVILDALNRVLGLVNSIKLETDSEQLQKNYAASA